MSAAELPDENIADPDDARATCAGRSTTSSTSFATASPSSLPG